jgi:hypothetical protein
VQNLASPQLTQHLASPLTNRVVPLFTWSDCSAFDVSGLRVVHVTGQTGEERCSHAGPEPYHARPEPLTAIGTLGAHPGVEGH